MRELRLGLGFRRVQEPRWLISTAAHDDMMGASASLLLRLSSAPREKKYDGKGG